MALFLDFTELFWGYLQQVEFCFVPMRYDLNFRQLQWNPAITNLAITTTPL